LDKNRNLQISRVKKHLEKFEEKSANWDKKDKNRYRDYYGPPYSYYYQFIDKENND